MKNIEELELYITLLFWVKCLWYGLAIGFFIGALFTGKEVYALLALVAAMMKKD